MGLYFACCFDGNVINKHTMYEINGVPVAELTVSALRGELDSRGLNSQGNRAALVSRLEAALQEVVRIIIY